MKFSTCAECNRQIYYREKQRANFIFVKEKVTSFPLCLTIYPGMSKKDFTHTHVHTQQFHKNSLIRANSSGCFDREKTNARESFYQCTINARIVTHVDTREGRESYKLHPVTVIRSLRSAHVNTSTKLIDRPRERETPPRREKCRKNFSKGFPRKNRVSGLYPFPPTVVIRQAGNPRLGTDRASHFPIRHWKNVSIELEYITADGGREEIRVGYARYTWWFPRIIFLVHTAARGTSDFAAASSRERRESAILLTCSCTRAALVRENISSYRQVAIAPGVWKDARSLARHDGLFMSKADLQAWKSPGPRAPLVERASLVLDKNACLYRARDTRTACIKGVIVSSSVFIWRTVQP